MGRLVAVKPCWRGQLRVNVRQVFNIEIADVLDMYIGASEQNIHAILKRPVTKRLALFSLMKSRRWPVSASTVEIAHKLIPLANF